MIKVTRKFALVVAASAWATSALAGFLEMPDTAEVPEYERSSLLLDMDIPAVRERDPNPEAGPRLNVKEFRVQGLVEYPELGITRAEIIKRVEKIRFEMMGEGKQFDSGYTLDEIAEVSDLVAEIEKETEGRHVTPVDVQKLVFLIREQRRKRGLTVGMIETVADTITRYYRERGFILAKAYIPKQHVRDGVVSITLLLGKLGEVEVQNNKRYSDKVIKRVFNSSLALPVVNSYVEQNLYLINDYPGLSVTGYFEPGTQVGDTKLNINAINEKRFSSNVRLDNHGSSSTGEYRAYTDFYWNNVTGLGDQLQLGVLGSFNPDNSVYGMVRYTAPIYTTRTMFSMGVSSNDFVAANGSTATSGFEITGKSLVTDAVVSYKIDRSRTKNQSINLGYSEIESQINFGDTRGASLDKSASRLELGYSFDLLKEQSRVLHQGGIIFSATNLNQGAEEGQEKSPYIFSFDYSRLSFIQLPYSESSAKLILRASGQYSGEALTEVFQFGLAGPTKARGYIINEFYGDDAVYLGADIIFNGFDFGGATIAGEKLSSVFQPFLFFDASYGKSHGIISGEEPVQSYLVDAGAGLKINLVGGLRGNLSFAFPISGKNEAYADTAESDEEDGELNLPKPGDGMKFYFDLQYGF